MPRTRPPYPEEFRRETVGLIRSGQRPLAGTDQADGLTTELLGVRRARPGHGHHILSAGPDRPKRSSVHHPGGIPGQRPVGLELERLTAADVSGFLVRECPRRTVAGARHLVSDLRPLLRYLHVAGLIETQLVWAVPGVADLRDRSLPRGLEPRVVARLLAGCDRRRTVGRRDYAIVLLLVRLGLRAAEVAAIQLEDLDWRRGEILIRGKRNRHDVLPLPVDVGEALVSYLQRRGPDQSRAVFLRVTAPAGPLTNEAVRGVVHD